MLERGRVIEKAPTAEELGRGMEGSYRTALGKGGLEVHGGLIERSDEYYRARKTKTNCKGGKKTVQSRNVVRKIAQGKWDQGTGKSPPPSSEFFSIFLHKTLKARDWVDL